MSRAFLGTGGPHTWRVWIKCAFADEVMKPVLKCKIHEIRHRRYMIESQTLLIMKGLVNTTSSRGTRK